MVGSCWEEYHRLIVQFIEDYCSLKDKQDILRYHWSNNGNLEWPHLIGIVKPYKETWKGEIEAHLTLEWGSDTKEK